MLPMPDTRYKRNAGAVFTLKYHLVWCPKYRKPVLGGPVAKRLKELLEEKAAELGATIHIAAQFKGFSSRILREEFPFLKSRLPALWSRSYYIGSVGHVSEATVKKYIANQKGR
jgi:putative transposase